MRFPVTEHQNQTNKNVYRQLHVQFKINTYGCWNWHMCIPDGLSVVQCSLGHVIGFVFLTQFQWHVAIVLDNWQLAVLPQSGGREFNPRRVHDNLSVPLWVYMGFPVPEHQNKPTRMCIYLHIYIYIFVVVNFDALAQASDIRIERRQVVFLCWRQDSNPRSQIPIHQQTECLLTNRLSYRGSS